MNTTPEVNELFLALSKAQGEFAVPVKNKRVAFKTKAGDKQEYWYSDLPELLRCVTKALVSNGLCHTATIEAIPGGIFLVVRVGHSSGQWIESGIPMRAPSGDPKSLGAEMTYGRRYLLSALLGLSADDDNEDHLPDMGSNSGNGNSEARPQGPVVPPAGRPIKPPSEKPIQPKVLDNKASINRQGMVLEEIGAELKATGWTSEQFKAICKRNYNAERVGDLPAGALSEIFAIMNKSNYETYLANAPLFDDQKQFS